MFFIFCKIQLMLHLKRQDKYISIHIKPTTPIIHRCNLNRKSRLIDNNNKKYLMMNEKENEDLVFIKINQKLATCFVAIYTINLYCALVSM